MTTHPAIVCRACGHTIAERIAPGLALVYHDGRHTWVPITTGAATECTAYVYKPKRNRYGPCGTKNILEPMNEGVAV